jgi:microcystin degradation protein MlrC
VVGNEQHTTQGHGYVLRMRIALGGIVHETNTYAVESFGLTTMESFDVSRGAAIRRHIDGRTFVGGMLTAAVAANYEIVPTLHAVAQPSGTIEASTYQALKAELVEGIAAALPVDAVVVDTHGAGIAEGVDDIEADLGAALRAVIGSDIPLITTLDLHGSITAEMNDVYDLMLGVYDYPHVDMFERGVEAIEAVPKLLSGEWVPTTHVERLPMLVPTSTTLAAPAQDIRQHCLDVQNEPGVLRGAFFHGFPYTDIPQAGASVVVTTNNDPALARKMAQRIAAQVWDRREEFRLESLSSDIALRQAAQAVIEHGGPVVANDTADNPGAGAPGDATHVLRALIEAAPDRACFGYVYDPGVARQAHESGAGSTMQVSLGGKHDELHGAPIDLHVYVKSTTDGRFVYTSPMLAGVPGNYGPMARLQVGGRDGLDILVGSRRSQVFDAEVFTLHGIDVTAYEIVVLKSSQHFRAGFDHLATGIITADSPGLSTLRVENFDHPRVDGPRWPIDPAAEWVPA